MQKQLNYIDYQVDLLTNDLDDMEVNKTMEVMDGMKERISRV